MRFRFGTEGDIDALSELVGRCFDDGPGSDLANLQRLAYRAIEAIRPETCWLAEDDRGEVVARWQIVRHTLTIRGVAIPAAGALGVAIDPEHRSPRFLKAFIDAGRVAWQELGLPVHIGFVEHGSPWALFGGVPIQPRYHVELDPARISGLPAEPLEPLPQTSEALLVAGELQAIVDRHNRLAVDRTGALERDPVAFAFQRHRPRELFVGEGVHLGLSAGNTLHVHEAESDAVEGAYALLQHAAALARERGLPLTADLPPDHPLVQAAMPRGVRVTTEWPRRSQGMGGLEGPQDLLDRLACTVPAGALTWVIRSEGQTWTLDRGGPMVEHALDRGALLQILVGYAPASAQRAARRLEASADEVALLDCVFPPLHPFTCLSDRF